MATAVTLTETTPGDLILIKGIVLDGVKVARRQVKRKRTHFWGVDGESEILGGHGGRDIVIPVIIYDDAEGTPDFDTPRKLNDYLEYTLGTESLKLNGTLKIYDAADRSEFLGCTFDGVEAMPGESVKHDDAGTLGGGYFALCMLYFYQLVSGEPQPPPPEP